MCAHTIISKKLLMSNILVLPERKVFAEDNAYALVFAQALVRGSVEQIVEQGFDGAEALTVGVLVDEEVQAAVMQAAGVSVRDVKSPDNYSFVSTGGQGVGNHVSGRNDNGNASDLRALFQESENLLIALFRIFSREKTFPYSSLPMILLEECLERGQPDGGVVGKLRADTFREQQGEFFSVRG